MTRMSVVQWWCLGLDLNLYRLIVGRVCVIVRHDAIGTAITCLMFVCRHIVHRDTVNSGERLTGVGAVVTSSAEEGSHVLAPISNTARAAFQSPLAVNNKPSRCQCLISRGSASTAARACLMASWTSCAGLGRMYASARWWYADGVGYVSADKVSNARAFCR